MSDMKTRMAESKYEPDGVMMFCRKSNRYLKLITEKGPYQNWLCYRHPDGQWVTLQESTEEDRARIAQAHGDSCLIAAVRFLRAEK